MPKMRRDTIAVKRMGSQPTRAQVIGVPLCHSGRVRFRGGGCEALLPFVGEFSLTRARARARIPVRGRGRARGRACARR